MKFINQAGSISLFLILCYVFFLSINYFIYGMVTSIFGIEEYDISAKESISDISALVLSFVFSRQYYKYISSQEKKVQRLVNYPIILFVSAGVILNVLYFLS